MRTKRNLTMPASMISPASPVSQTSPASQAVDLSPAQSTQMTLSSPPKKRQTRKEKKAVKRALNMDTESDSSSEEDIKVLALMHKLDPAAPPFKLDRRESDIFEKLPPLPGLLLQELNKTDMDPMDQDQQPPEPPMTSEDDAGPPELLRSLGKRPAPSIPSITSSLKKFAKPPRHMDGGSSAYNATRLARTKSVCFQRTRSPEATPTWGGGALALPDVLVTPTKPTTPVALAWGGGNGGPPRPFVVPDVLVTPTKPPPTPPTPPTPGSPDVPPPDVNACSPINIAAAILPVPAKPPPNPDSLHGTIRNLFALTDPELGIAEFANFDD